MPLDVAPHLLDRLDWPEVASRLARLAASPLGEARLAGPPEALFAPDRERAKRRLAETGEARALLDAGEVPPFEGAHDVAPHLERLRRGGHLEGPELLAVAGTLRACTRVGRFLRSHAPRAPRLAAQGARLLDREALALELERALNPEGRVRDEASRELAAARRALRSHKLEMQGRVERLLRDPELGPALQDRFVTQREGRSVVPVRADARARVPGIVHDASASGTTLFIEPQALVEAGNRVREAELAVARETRRVLEALCASVAPDAPALLESQEMLAALDAAFARGRLSREMEGSAPELDDAGGFALRALRHPLIAPHEVVPNDLRLAGDTRVLVLSGPNAGGKTVALKALALCPLLAWAGLHIPAHSGSRMPWIERLLGDIGDDQDLRQHLSTFSAHLASLARIVEAAGAGTLVVLDEVGVGTDPAEGAALAQAVLETLADADARVVATTHFGLLKELAALDPRFENASVEFDPRTLAPTFRLRHASVGQSSATALAARMGLGEAVLARAKALLAQEDRRLDRLVAELSESRAAVEREREEAARMRAESEAARERYESRLARLNAQREKRMAELRARLEATFEDAHRRVAEVIRALQRGGDARAAARAREALLELERESETATAGAREAGPAGAPRPAIDWRRARVGDPVVLPTGQAGRLLTLPDERGRATVQVGGARLRLEAEKLAAAAEEVARERAGASAPPGRAGRATSSASPASNRSRIATPPLEAGAGARLDLRGLRVDEALPRLEEALDRAARVGGGSLDVIHGIGSGTLRRAVRRHLAVLPYRLRIEDAPPREGGDGVTRVELAD